MGAILKTKLLTDEVAAGRAIADRLPAALAPASAAEHWLLAQVGPAYDALKADPVPSGERRAGTRPPHRGCVARLNARRGSQPNELPMG